MGNDLPTGPAVPFPDGGGRRRQVVSWSRSPRAIAAIALLAGLAAGITHYLAWAWIRPMPAYLPTYRPDPEFCLIFTRTPQSYGNVDRVPCSSLGYLLGSPVWDDVLFAGLVAVVGYFLLVGLILSVRAIRGPSR